ncbi:phosphotransferase family protein [Microbacterium hydrocarbonoxydans]|uniref:phosphotransferase family protein n=1 Tax=Microbacterium hydrocarbonoxydans TaxID=273678 RepID=UPI00203C887C|nr:phosphotransferase [Microbacterium hydrocarbonoxydans]MCM3781295.1 phosphotransferase [Microbacterium hydrocarbonoxydans]
MRQGAVGAVRLVARDGVRLIEKRMPDAERHRTEVRALQALSSDDLPTPELVEDAPWAILMTEMPGRRLDEVDAETRLAGLSASASLLRRLHEVQTPAGLAPRPDDATIVARYRASDGPPLPLVIPPSSGQVFCHGDWTDGNLLFADGRITGIVDWEASHVGDPLRELSRAAWGAGRKDPRSSTALIDAYGADADEVHRWDAIHAAELWLWFAEAGPPEYLARLTAELRVWET